MPEPLSLRAAGWDPCPQGLPPFLLHALLGASLRSFEVLGQLVSSAPSPPPCPPPHLL